MTLPVADILQPLVDAAHWILFTFHDNVGFGWGMSIVAMTIVVRLAIVPLTIRQIKAMNAMRALQPQMKELQAKYKDDRQRLNQEMMKFYRENNVNPLSSCLPLLLQLPVFIALFSLLRSSSFKDAIESSGQTSFLFVANLAEKAQGGELAALIVLYVGSQLASSVVMSVAVDGNQKFLMYGLPFIFVPLIIGFPSGLIVYWITTNIWTFGQQVVVRRVAPPVPVAAAAVATVGGDGGAAKAPPPPPKKKKRRRR